MRTYFFYIWSLNSIVWYIETHKMKFLFTLLTVEISLIFWLLPFAIATSKGFINRRVRSLFLRFIFGLFFPYFFIFWLIHFRIFLTSNSTLFLFHLFQLFIFSFFLSFSLSLLLFVVQFSGIIIRLYHTAFCVFNFDI